MNFSQLQYFATAAASGSYAAAAKKLFVNPSTISASIASLEKEIGISLLNRSNAGVEPTCFGEMFLHAANEVLGSVGRLEKLSEDFKAGRESANALTVAIATSYWSGSVIPKAIFESFGKKVTGAKITVLESSSVSCSHAIEHGLVDAAFTFDHRDTRDLVNMPIFEVPIYALASTANAKITSSNALDANLLCELPIATPCGFGPLLALIIEACSHANGTPTLINVGPSKKALQNFFDKQHGIALVASTINLEQRYDGVRTLGLSCECASRLPVHFVYRSGDSSRLLKEFANYVSRRSWLPAPNPPESPLTRRNIADQYQHLAEGFP